MKKELVLIASVFLGTSVWAGPEDSVEVREDPVEVRDEPAACQQAQSTCLQQCDDEKVLWLFKGEAYRTCAVGCEAARRDCEQRQETGPSRLEEEDVSARGNPVQLNGRDEAEALDEEIDVPEQEPEPAEDGGEEDDWRADSEDDGDGGD